MYLLPYSFNRGTSDVFDGFQPKLNLSNFLLNLNKILRYMISRVHNIKREESDLLCNSLHKHLLQN